MIPVIIQASAAGFYGGFVKLLMAKTKKARKQAFAEMTINAAIGCAGLAYAYLAHNFA